MESPILQAELRHQRRGALGLRRRGLRRLSFAALLVGFAVDAALIAMEFLAATNRQFDFILTGLESLVVIVGHVMPSVILLPLTLFFHLTLMFRTLMLSSDVIAREQRSGTWQLLMLTEQSPARIILGKWWATVRYLTPQYALLSILRVGVIIYLGLERYRIDYFYFGSNSRQFFSRTQPLSFFVDPSTLLVGAALITLFTFVNLLFTAALGVLISALRRGGHAGERLAFAFALRTVILVVPAALLIWLGEQAYASSIPMPFVNYYNMTTYLSGFGVSLLDNGSLVSAALLAHGKLNFILWRSYTQYVPIEIALFVFGFYALIIGAALRASIWSLRKATP